jgi:hypothetical protein
VQYQAAGIFRRFGARAGNRADDAVKDEERDGAPEAQACVSVAEEQLGEEFLLGWEDTTEAVAPALGRRTFCRHAYRLRVQQM